MRCFGEERTRRWWLARIAELERPAWTLNSASATGNGHAAVERRLKPVRVSRPCGNRLTRRAVRAEWAHHGQDAYAGLILMSPDFVIIEHYPSACNGVQHGV